MFRRKVIIIVYELIGTKSGKGCFSLSCRLFSYGTLFEKAFEMLAKKYGSDSFLVTNVIKL